MSVAATNVVVDTLSSQRGRGKGKIYWRAVSFFTELYWPVSSSSSSSSRFPFLLAGFSRAFLLVSRCLTRFLQPSSPRSWRRVYCLVEISPILTRIDSTRERERERRGGERGIEIGTELEIILILVRARNIRNSGNQK